MICDVPRHMIDHTYGSIIDQNLLNQNLIIMILAEIIAIIIITLLFGSIFYYGFKRSGPWGSFWTFILVLFLIITLATIWIEPIGPVWYGAAWIDIFIIGLIFALILASAKPMNQQGKRKEIYHKADIEREEEKRVRNAAALGLFFWITIIVLITATVISIFI